MEAKVLGKIKSLVISRKGFSQSCFQSASEYLSSKGKTKDDHSIQLAGENDYDSLAHEMVHSFLLLFKEVEEDNKTWTGKTIGDMKVNDIMIKDLEIKYNSEVDVSSSEKDGVVSYAAHNSLFYECLYNCFLLWGPDHIKYYAYDNFIF